MNGRSERTEGLSRPGPRGQTSPNRIAWRLVQQWIRRSFPDVRHMSVAELSHRMESEPRPILLDTRTKEEFQISHLPGAVLAEGSPEKDEGIAEAMARGRPIVVYCSIGYRSSRAAKRLAESGALEVYNLEGSIFLWANHGHPVMRGDRKVGKVHPYSRLWSLLLRRDLRAPLMD